MGAFVHPSLNNKPPSSKLLTPFHSPSQRAPLLGINNHLPPPHHFHFRTCHNTPHNQRLTQQHPLRAISAASAAAAATTATAPAGLSSQAIFYMFLLAIQFGTQPGLTRRFTPKTVCRSTVVLGQEVIKLGIAMTVLLASGNWVSAVSGWSIKTWLAVAGLPAALYCIQNYATLMAYQNLDPLTFNVLNQTKTLSAALCCFLIIGRRQSPMQIVSLLLLFASALVIEKIIPLNVFSQKPSTATTTATDSTHSDTTEQNDKTQSEPESSSSPSKSKSKSMTHLTQGVLPVLLASFISGLAGALVQKNLQSATGCGISGGRNSYLFTAELSLASLFFLVASMVTGPDRRRIAQKGFFDGWTPKTLIPMVTNAAGGVVVGLVTKYAGSVKKGFALIFGLLLSGILQAVIPSKNGGGGEGAAEERKKRGVSKEQIVGAILASVSLWMHSVYPYTPPVIAK